MTDPALAPRGSALLWFAVFGGPIAWFVSLSVGYFGVHEACAHQTALLPRVVSLLALFFALGAAVAAWRLGSRVGRATGQPNEGSPGQRTRFLAQIGMLGGATFSLIILLQVVATLILPSCRERPRAPGAPDVLRTSPAYLSSLT